MIDFSAVTISETNKRICAGHHPLACSYTCKNIDLIPESSQELNCLFFSSVTPGFVESSGLFPPGATLLALNQTHHNHILGIKQPQRLI